MCDEWMPTMKLGLTLDEFHQLPRNPAFKYEYLGGKAWITPRPKHYHAVLELAPRSTEPEPGLPALTFRHVTGEDWPRLEEMFSAAFRTTQPFGSLNDATRIDAARQVLVRTRTGGDGPWIESASFLAQEGDKTVGAILITLVPPGDPCDSEDYRWQEPPPDDAIARRLGRPHLTWIFTSPLSAGHGVGSALLARSVNVLCELGFTQLCTTFVLGNDSSILWHWRNGFQLVAFPGSYRHMHLRWLHRK